MLTCPPYLLNAHLLPWKVLGHRVEVRDLTGDTHSVLMYPEAGQLDYSKLRCGNTLFIRYAHRCFFSDLSSEAIKVEDLNMVHIVEASLDSLLYLSGAWCRGAAASAAAGSRHPAAAHAMEACLRPCLSYHVYTQAPCAPPAGSASSLLVTPTTHT